MFLLPSLPRQLFDSVLTFLHNKSKSFILTGDEGGSSINTKMSLFVFNVLHHSVILKVIKDDTCLLCVCVCVF